MRKHLRIGVAALLATSGLIVTANSSSAGHAVNEDPVDVVDCTGDDAPVEGPIPTPRVTIPDDENTDPNDPPTNDGIPLTGDPVLGAENNCAELRRTIVFNGIADISENNGFEGQGNGVNFAGNGSDDVDTLGTGGAGKYGNGYEYAGECVLVDWVNGQVAAQGLSGCAFSADSTKGTYGGPGTGQGNGLFNPIGRCIEDGAQPECPTAPGTTNYTGLDWAPDDQASCFNSDGQGVSAFVSKNGTETWSATYTWNDSLDNLRGSVSGTQDNVGLHDLGTYPFDAKIEAQANPQAGDALDATAVGCLQKTVTANQDGDGNPATYDGTETTGLNSILIVGTASWRVVVPEVLFP